MVPNRDDLQDAESFANQVETQLVVVKMRGRNRLGVVYVLNYSANLIGIFAAPAIARFGEDNGAVGENNFQVRPFTQGHAQLNPQSIPRNVSHDPRQALTPQFKNVNFP